MMKRMTTQQRFWSKVELDIPDKCWNWQGPLRNGYGRFNLEGSLVTAHRFSYELIKGKIPEELQIDHLCRNRKCVNPSHLEAVTQKENVLRGHGLSANYARRTHCNKGHPFTKDNLYNNKYGARVCKKCDMERKREERKK